jgi:hypothetical protein
LQIKEWNSCRNNEVVALRISATFASEGFASGKKYLDIAKETKWLHCNPLRFLPPDPRNAKKNPELLHQKKESRSSLDFGSSPFYHDAR